MRQAHSASDRWVGYLLRLMGRSVGHRLIPLVFIRQFLEEVFSETQRSTGPMRVAQLVQPRSGPARGRTSWSRPYHHLDRLAVVHRPVAVRHLVEVHDAVEDAAGLDPALENVRQELFDVREHRGRLSQPPQPPPLMTRSPRNLPERHEPLLVDSRFAARLHRAYPTPLRTAMSEPPLLCRSCLLACSCQDPPARRC